MCVCVCVCSVALYVFPFVYSCIFVCACVCVYLCLYVSGVCVYCNYIIKREERERAVGVLNPLFRLLLFFISCRRRLMRGHFKRSVMKSIKKRNWVG